MIERNIDQLGRIVLPKEMRDKLGLKNGDVACIEMVDNKIVISNPSKEDPLNKVVQYFNNFDKLSFTGEQIVMLIRELNR